MLTTHPLHELARADARGRELRADAAAERMRGVSPVRHAVAAALRRTADRLEPARLAPGPQLLVKER